MIDIERCADVFMNVFRGRTDVYAIQRNDYGNVWYQPIHAPLDTRIIRRHLGGEITIGSYLMVDDNMVNFAAIDIDIERKDQRHWQALKKYASSVVEAGRIVGIDIVIASSGNRGDHLYVLFEEPIRADRAIRLLKILAFEEVRPVPQGIHVELFPKQVTTSNLGNLIKLPCGIHRKTGNRSLFLDKEFKEIKDQEGYILGLPEYTVGKETVNRIMSDYPDVEARPTWDGQERRLPYYRQGGSPENAVKRCAFLRSQLTNKNQGYDEWLAVLSIVIPFGDEGVYWAHKLSQSYVDYSQAEVRHKVNVLRRGGLLPHSCHTIRSRFSKCPDDCRLKRMGNGEPSPIRFCYQKNKPTKTRNDYTDYRRWGRHG